MTKTEVLELLEANRDERGVSRWEKTPRTLKSFGIGLTQLRNLTKKVGRDQEPAQELWLSDVYDARVLCLLPDEPNKTTREQAEEQVGDLQHGILCRVVASCDATLAKAPLAFDLAREWMGHDDPARRRCGYLLLYELPKKNPTT